MDISESTLTENQGNNDNPQKTNKMYDFIKIIETIKNTDKSRFTYKDIGHESGVKKESVTTFLSMLRWIGVIKQADVKMYAKRTWFDKLVSLSDVELNKVMDIWHKCEHNDGNFKDSQLQSTKKNVLSKYRHLHSEFHNMKKIIKYNDQEWNTMITALKDESLTGKSPRKKNKEQYGTKIMKNEPTIVGTQHETRTVVNERTDIETTIKERIREALQKTQKLNKMQLITQVKQNKTWQTKSKRPNTVIRGQIYRMIKDKEIIEDNNDYLMLSAKPKEQPCHKEKKDIVEEICNEMKRESIEKMVRNYAKDMEQEYGITWTDTEIKNKVERKLKSLAR